MRLQLAQADNNLVDPEVFNQMFTMHGTTMIFLVVMPLTSAFFNMVIPLAIGARDVAFPRLNAFSYWTFLLGALLIHASFLTMQPPAAGWFSYANLTEKPFSPGQGLDYWALSLQVLGVASMAAAFNFIVTIVNMRAPGMSLMRMPLFVWMTLVTSILIVLAFPVLTVGLIELTFDRLFQTNFFRASEGGDPVLWQHLFWIFGHPEVYIVFLPAIALVAMIVPTFAQRPIVGYTWIVLAAVGTGFISFGLWVHHMYATGLPVISLSFFSAASEAVVVP